MLVLLTPAAIGSKTTAEHTCAYTSVQEQPIILTVAPATTVFFC